MGRIIYKIVFGLVVFLALNTSARAEEAPVTAAPTITPIQSSKPATPTETPPLPPTITPNAVTKTPLTAPVPATLTATAPIAKPLKSIVQDAEAKPPETKAEVTLPPPEFPRSLMYDDELLKQYNAVYDDYQEKMKNKPVKAVTDGKLNDVINKLTATDDKLLPPPNGIYLNSILFRPGLSGIAWIDGLKYQPDITAGNIKVVELNQNSVTIIWSANGSDIDLSQWAAIFPSSAEANADTSKLKNDQQTIRIDAKAKTIQFTLKPNQHLDFTQMAVREGKPAPAPAKTADAKTEVAKDAPSGLGKLLDQAKKAVDDEKPGDKTPPVDPDAKSVSFKISPDGHFYVPAKLNGTSVNFKVDTGATVTAISTEQALLVGVDVSKLDYKFDVKLADGSIVKAAQANIADFVIDPLVTKDVNILISQGAMAQPLIGMSFFSKLKKFTIEGDMLTLYQ